MVLMHDIVLATLNAKYIHSAFGLRYLHANLGDLASRAAVLEFTIQQRPIDIVERIQREHARIVGFGVYIWNMVQTKEVVSILKRLRPDLTIVLGGPEVSYEIDAQEIVKCADYVVTGEADSTFPALCRDILEGRAPENKIIRSPVPDVKTLALPYHLYTNDDLSNRVVYVEASRGCPFTCEFCLSSLEIPVRQFAIEPFLAAMEDLYRRGATQFKFVDRTFNLNIRFGKAILEFFLERMKPGLFLHFEMVPDRFPVQLKEIVKKFPPGSLQFEVGIQSFNPDVGVNISRRQDYAAIEENLTFLRGETGVHVHADLIIGLPGEDVESFARGFDRLLAIGPQEIQVGILKRLKGTPIVRHDSEWQMVYSPEPPFEILQNKLLDFPLMQRLRRFARYWDLVGNSGNFRHSRELIWQGRPSAFFAFLEFSDWLYANATRTDSIGLPRLREFVRKYLVEQRGVAADDVDEVLLRDERKIRAPHEQAEVKYPPRQQRFLEAGRLPISMKS